MLAGMALLAIFPDRVLRNVTAILTNTAAGMTANMNMTADTTATTIMDVTIVAGVRPWAASILGAAPR